MNFVKLKSPSGDVIVNVSEIELIVEKTDCCEIFLKSAQIVAVSYDLPALQLALGI